MERKRVLVVDDEAVARRTLAHLLRHAGYEVEHAADAFKGMAKYAAFTPHVVITDLRLPGMDGLAFARRLREETEAAIIIVTAYGEVSTAVEAMRAGVAEYFVKPVDFEQLLVVLAPLVEHEQARFVTRHRREARVAPSNIIGTSPAMHLVYEMLDLVARSRSTVLVTGETGSGKDLVAHAIHMRSARANHPFVKVHCAALVETLLESELFGHERGAFTGALTRTDGKFQLADGGTLFLDEIGEISPAVQVKLLRFLQEREFERVGGTKTIHVDVRVIVATNRRLEIEVIAKRFREDLFYRMNVVALEVPPLRARSSDVPDLARVFLQRFGEKSGKHIDGFTPEALDVMQRYSWPGNVRELEHVVERAVVFSTTAMIGVDGLPPALLLVPAPPHGMPHVPGATLAQVERFAIEETLKSTGGSTAKAARMLGISARTIQYRMLKYGAAS